MLKVEERRQFPRRVLNLKVLHTHPKTQKAVIDFSKDVSQGGFFLWTKRQRAVGDILKVELSATPPFQHKGVIRGSCKVLRVTADGIAASFVGLDDASEEVLATLLARAGG
ncbi:MAG: PilZ domain-containing protein [Myxococcaceae bacterium]